MKKDYLKLYSTNPVTKFQEGGAMPAPEAAPQQGGSDIEQMLMAAYESQDPNLALQAVNAIVESMGGGAPQEGQPAPMGRNGMRIGQPAPKFRVGGKLV